jgi:hypothetical protein
MNINPTLLLILPSLVVIIFWAFFTKSGQEFFKKNNREWQEKIEAENKLTSTAEAILQKSKFPSLINEFQKLSTFSDVMKWDIRANLELKSLIDDIQLFDLEIDRQSKKLNGHRIVNKHIIEKHQTKYRTVMIDMAEKLQEAIDFTPNSLTEQKLLLKELRQRKKELQLQKREVTASAKQIRREARIKISHAGRVLGIIYNSKLAASERRRIRYTKEAALLPHEELMSSIERQILQIDKDIFWVERFTN